jgi:hypothetical protein
MTMHEQENIKQKGYAEAMRYMDNAKKTLEKAGMDGKWYKDRKYVRTACGTAYNGALEALDTWLLLKGVELPKSNARGNKKGKSIKFYDDNVKRLKQKMGRVLDSVYTALHLNGYYDGILDSEIIKVGFKSAKELIDLIKPEGEAA